jgi:ribosome-associated protein
VCTTLEDNKGENVAVFDVHDKSSITDYYVVVSGNSAPHLKALSEEVMHKLKEKGETCYRNGGVSEGGWLVLDYVDVIIHIFSTQAREYYAVEELWG